MSDISRHPHEALHEALDGRLDPAERADLERHLATCESCRRELEALRWTKARVASLRSEEALPPQLAADLRRALNESDKPQDLDPRGAIQPAAHAAPQARRGRWLAIAAALVFALVGLWSLPRLWRETLPDQVASDYREYRSGELALAVQTNDVNQIAAYFRGANIPFEPRVFDLGMMQYQAVGGLAHRLDGRPSALFVYRGSDGRLLVCQMYLGRLDELPTPQQRLTNNGIEFLVYRLQEVTAVFWQEGAETCVLVSDGDPQTVIDLAFAKAMRIS